MRVFIIVGIMTFPMHSGSLLPCSTITALYFIIFHNLNTVTLLPSIVLFRVVVLLVVSLLIYSMERIKWRLFESLFLRIYHFRSSYHERGPVKKPPIKNDLQRTRFLKSQTAIRSDFINGIGCGTEKSVIVWDNKTLN